MRGRANGRPARAAVVAPAVAGAEPGRAGAPPEAAITRASLVLPCALVVFGATREAETGKPLSDLLRRIGYL